MTPIKQHLELLAKQLNLTGIDEEPESYILTAEEEKEAITYAIQKAKENYQYKHLNFGDRLADIEMKMAEIDWLEKIDVDEILKSCNSKKNYEVWQKQKNEEERLYKIKLTEQQKQKYTAKFVYNIMAWNSFNSFGKDFKVHDGNRRLITAVCFFLSNDHRFETELGYSFKKGLLVRGVSGIGKTFIFNCVKNNDINPIKIYSMVSIAEAVKSEGYFTLPPHEGLIYLDDVGSEEHTVNHYGTKINFFKDFIEKYYLNSTEFNKLIFSTNNNFAELEAKYGFRVRSRLKDMFNTIDVEGNDMRG